MKQLIFVILFVFSVPFARAENYDMDVKKFAVMEGFVFLNAGLATADPEVYGTALAILSPLGMSSNSSKTTNYVGVSGAITLGLYNALELSDERYSSKDVFVSNLYGWHALAAITYITEELMGQSYGTEYLAMRLSDKGFSVALNYAF